MTKLNFVTKIGKYYSVDVNPGTSIKNIKDELEKKNIKIKKLIIELNYIVRELPDDYIFTQEDIDYHYIRHPSCRKIIL